MNRKPSEDINIVDEIVTIRKELQSIRVILQSQFIRDYEIERTKVDGKTVRTRRTLEDPLGELRKRYNIDQ